MIKRRITSNGLLNISKQIRGDALSGKIVLEFQPGEAGILISPYDAKKKYSLANSHRCRFDQYNRITIPERIRALSKIGTNVEVQIREDGTLLLLPIKYACVFCGSDQHLTKFPHDRYICRECIAGLKKDAVDSHKDPISSPDQ